MSWERAITAGIQSDLDPINVFTIAGSAPTTTTTPIGRCADRLALVAKNTASLSGRFIAFLLCA